MITDILDETGAGESGKSTVLKQMRLINSGGFSEQERKQWRVVIFNNLVQAFVVILKAMDEHAVSYDASNTVRSMCWNISGECRADPGICRNMRA